MNELIACCGIDCSQCEARIATLNNDNKLRSRVAHKWSKCYCTRISPDQVNCMGCRVTGADMPFCNPMCDIRRCASRKHFSSCADCPVMETCSTLARITYCNPDALKNLLAAMQEAK